uniref:Uncharacterized protein n=1 Tax=Zea mays TaxID=4577 RepID=B7ZZ86_MAIZE|nr:unknown [Zea mays]
MDSFYRPWHSPNYEREIIHQFYSSLSLHVIIQFHQCSRSNIFIWDRVTDDELHMDNICTLCKSSFDGRFLYLRRKVVNIYCPLNFLLETSIVLGSLFLEVSIEEQPSGGGCRRLFSAPASSLDLGLWVGRRCRVEADAVFGWCERDDAPAAAARQPPNTSRAGSCRSAAAAAGASSFWPCSWQQKLQQQRRGRMRASSSWPCSCWCSTAAACCLVVLGGRAGDPIR